MNCVICEGELGGFDYPDHHLGCHAEYLKESAQDAWVDAEKERGDWP